MTSDNRWDPSDIQIPHHSSVIVYIKGIHHEKYTDNSKYDILIGRIYIIYTTRIVEGLLDEAATLSEITKKESHSKLDAKILVQIWRIGLRPAQYTLKTKTQVGIKHALHPLTCRYKTDIIHRYNARRLKTTFYFDTLFPKFR